MFDRVSTCGGRYGFVVVYPGGRRVSELEATWDLIPHSHSILELCLYDFQNGTELLSLAGFEKYYFSNEAVSGPNGMQLVAKYFGGINSNSNAAEIKVDFLKDPPSGFKRDYLAREYAGSLAGLRPGIKI